MNREVESGCKRPFPDLASYSTEGFDRGASLLVELAWLIVQAVLISSFLPGSWHRRLLWRAFGAKVDSGVIVKPGVRVKFPWRLRVGRNSWIGEGVWIDNLAL